MPQMDDKELKALLQAARVASLGGPLTSDLSSERARALDYYNGEMADDMPSAEGRSSAVSSDVADTVEGLMPSLMEIFAAGEEVVRFEPVGPQDEQAAMQETDYVNHVFMQKNPGFMVLYTFIKDALLSKNGVVKVYWDKGDDEKRETYLDQADDAFAIMAADPESEIIAHTEHKNEQTGETLHDVTVAYRKTYGVARAMPVPPEEFGISKFARTIKDSDYCFHEPQNITEASLIAQGFDSEQVKSLPTFGLVEKEEQIARDTLHEEQTSTGSMDRSSRRIRMVEHYIRMDYEGNDKPLLYKVSTGGNELIVLKRNGESDIEQVDEMPFAAMTPVPITHRFFGKSIADLVMDIQRIKTALLRQLLDNAYLANNQRLQVAESLAHERTLDDLLVNRPGAIVRVKQMGAIEPIPNQEIGSFAFPLIEYIDSTRELRTGITRQGQGLKADSLQNQSATAVNQVFSAAQARMKLIARIFAETGIRDLFSLLHGVIRKNDDKANTVRLRNKWVTVDPRDWQERDDMTINVGLGTGSRQDEMAFLTNILGIQKEIVMAPPGPFTALVEPKNIYNTLEKLVERGGLKTIEPYFSDPSAPDPMTGQPKQPPAPPPNPDVMKVQGQLQLQGQQAQADMQFQQQKLAADAQANQAKFGMEADAKQKQLVAEYQLKREQMAAEYQLKREQMAAEMAMQREQFQVVHAEKVKSGFYLPRQSTSVGDPVRMGGQIG